VNEPNTEMTVFVSDASAEAEAISSALRDRSFVVSDVPLSMLVPRVSVQRPRVVLIDADAEGSLTEIGKMRELPGAESIHVLFLGKSGSTFSSSEEALAHEGSGFFPRPVDVTALVKKVEALIAAPQAEPSPEAASVKRSEPPPATISLKRLSAPPPSMTSSPRVAMHGPLSTELETLLADAEARVGENVFDVFPPSPEDELAAVLPEDVLRALDEPIGDEDAEEDERVDTGQRHLTSGGSARETTGSRRATEAPPTLSPTRRRQSQPRPAPLL